MISCAYTADKNRKRKRWKDGFVKVRDGKVIVYSEEMRIVCSFHSKMLKEEYETARYIVYIEDYGEPETSRKERSVEEMLGIIDTIKKVKKNP